MMYNLNLSFYSFHFIDFIQEKIFSLTSQNKRILIVATIAFAVLAACCFKASPLNDAKEESSHPEQLQQKDSFVLEKGGSPKAKVKSPLDFSTRLSSADKGSNDLVEKITPIEQRKLNTENRIQILNLQRQNQEGNVKTVSLTQNHKENMNCCCDNQLNQYDVKHLQQVQEALEGIAYSVRVNKSDFSSTVTYKYPLDVNYSSEKLVEIIDNLHQLLQKKHDFNALKTGYSFIRIFPPEHEKGYFENLKWNFPKIKS